MFFFLFSKSGCVIWCEFDCARGGHCGFGGQGVGCGLRSEKEKTSLKLVGLILECSCPSLHCYRYSENWTRCYGMSLGFRSLARFGAFSFFIPISIGGAERWYTGRSPCIAFSPLF